MAFVIEDESGSFGSDEWEQSSPESVKQSYKTQVQAAKKPQSSGGYDFDIEDEEETSFEASPPAKARQKTPVQVRAVARAPATSSLQVNSKNAAAAMLSAARENNFQAAAAKASVAASFAFDESEPSSSDSGSSFEESDLSMSSPGMKQPLSFGGRFGNINRADPLASSTVVRGQQQLAAPAAGRSPAARGTYDFDIDSSVGTDISSHASADLSARSGGSNVLSPGGAAGRGVASPPGRSSLGRGPFSPAPVTSPGSAPGSAAGSALSVGTRVLSRYGGAEEYYPGVVTALNTDGTYAVTYEDGDMEEFVPRYRIRTALHAPGSSSSSGSPRADSSASSQGGLDSLGSPQQPGGAGAGAADTTTGSTASGGNNNSRYGRILQFSDISALVAQELRGGNNGGAGGAGGPVGRPPVGLDAERAVGPGSGPGPATASTEYRYSVEEDEGISEEGSAFHPDGDGSGVSGGRAGHGPGAHGHHHGHGGDDGDEDEYGSDEFPSQDFVEEDEALGPGAGVGSPSGRGQHGAGSSPGATRRPGVALPGAAQAAAGGMRSPKEGVPYASPRNFRVVPGSGGAAATAAGANAARVQAGTAGGVSAGRGTYNLGDDDEHMEGAEGSGYSGDDFEAEGEAEEQGHDSGSGQGYRSTAGTGTRGKATTVTEIAVQTEDGPGMGMGMGMGPYGYPPYAYGPGPYGYPMGPGMGMGMQAPLPVFGGLAAASAAASGVRPVMPPPLPYGQPGYMYGGVPGVPALRGPLAIPMPLLGGAGVAGTGSVLSALLATLERRAADGAAGMAEGASGPVPVAGAPAAGAGQVGVLPPPVPAVYGTRAAPAAARTGQSATAPSPSTLYLRALAAALAKTGPNASIDAGAGAGAGEEGCVAQACGLSHASTQAGVGGGLASGVEAGVTGSGAASSGSRPGSAAAGAEAKAAASGKAPNLARVAREAGLHPSVTAALAKYQAGLGVADGVFARQLAGIRQEAARAKAKVAAMSQPRHAPPPGGSPQARPGPQAHAQPSVAHAYAPRLSEMQAAFQEQRSKRPGLSFEDALRSVQAGVVAS